MTILQQQILTIVKQVKSLLNWNEVWLLFQGNLCVVYNFYRLLGFMINAMQRTRWMQWMADFWMEGSFASKWHGMEDRRLHIVDTAGGGG